MFWSPPHRGADRNRADNDPIEVGRMSPPHRGADRNGQGVNVPGMRGVSPPHRGADRNTASVQTEIVAGGRPLTGARIETPTLGQTLSITSVAPSQGRGSKHLHGEDGGVIMVSPPHRGADRNCRPTRTDQRGAESPPHRGADRNHGESCRERQAPCRPLTGARIET